MGAGASFGPSLEAGLELNLDAEWRSETTRELDRLGGAFRPAIKRGLSQKYLLEWLKDAVHEQGDRLEEALAKDPNAGRHEIARQEALKLAKQYAGAHHRFTVREWQTMRHTDLRAREREEAERLRREKEREKAAGGQPLDPAARWVQSLQDQPRRLPSLQQGEEGSGRAGAVMSTDLPTPTAEWRVRVARAKRKAMMVISVVLALRGRKHRARGLQRLDSLSFFIAQHLGPELPRFIDEQGSYRATKANAAGLQALAEEVWREQRRNATADGDGDPGPAPVPDSDAFAAGPPSISAPHSAPLHDLSALSLGYGRPASPRTPSANGAYPGPPSVVSGLGAGGAFRGVQPPPPLRLPGGAGGGGGGGVSLRGSESNLGGAATPTAAGPAAGSGLLRSRPLNLTPSLHHISQAGAAPVVPAGMPPLTIQVPPPQLQPPGPPVRPMSSSALPSPSGPGPSSASAASAAAAAAAAAAGISSSGAFGSLTSASGSLPSLRPRSAIRMSMPNGLGHLERSSPLGNEAASGLTESRKSMRFSAPGGDAEAEKVGSCCSSSGGAAMYGSATDDGTAAEAGPGSVAAVAVAAALAEPAAAEGKRWSAMRFLRRKDKAPDGGSAGGAASGGRRGGGPGALLAEELSLVERSSQSWAGPNPIMRPQLQALIVPHSRSLGTDGAISPSSSVAPPGVALPSSLSPGGGGGGVPPPLPAPPQLPLPPMGTRGPRSRRDSGLMLLGATPGGPPPGLAIPFGVRSPNAGGDYPGAVLLGSLGLPGPTPGAPGMLAAPAPAPGPSSVSLPVATPMAPLAGANGDERFARPASAAGSAGAGSAGGAKTRAGSTGSSPPGRGGGGGGSRAGSAPRQRRQGGGGGGSSVGGGGGGSRAGGSDPTATAPSVLGGEAAGLGGGGGGGGFLGEREHMLGGPTVRRMVLDGSGDLLLARSQEENAALERPMRMMQMYANRANARWVEEVAAPTTPSSPTTATSAPASSSPLGGGGGGGGGSGGGGGGGWEPPHVYDASRFVTAVGGAQSAAFKAEVVSMLRAGKIAVQLLAGDDQILLANGQPQALWSADPWDLIASAFPAKASTSERIRQVRMGPRLLMALVMAVEALAGPEALSRLVVVLHMNEEQQEEVVHDLRYRKFCGLSRENLILLVQQRRHGYAWDRDHQVFMRDDSSQLASAGSGYAIMQLVWPEESYQVAPEEPATAAAPSAPPTGIDFEGGGAAAGSSIAAVSSSLLVPMGVSVVDYLLGRGVEWLLTRRLRDINLYHPEMTLDPDVLAYSVYLSESVGANMSVQVEFVDGVQAARSSHSGVVLAPPRLRRGGGGAGAPPGQPPPPSAAAAATATPSLGSPLRRAGAFASGSGSSRRPNPLRLGSDVGGGAAGSSALSDGAGGGGAAAASPHFVVDVKISDTATPRVTQILNEARAKAKGRLAVSTRRYLWRVEVLKALVQRPSVFRPSLEVAGDLAFLTFDMADLTAAAELGARCVGVSTRQPCRSLTSAADLEDLMNAIAAQDASSHFRRLAGNTSPLPHAYSMPSCLDATGRRNPIPPVHSLSYGPSTSTFPSPAAALGPASIASAPCAPSALGAPSSPPRALQRPPSAALSSSSGGQLQTQFGGDPGGGRANNLAFPAPGPVPGPLGPPGGGGGGAAAGGGGAGGGQRVVVFVANNESTGMAVQLLLGLLKPGRDVVYLVHVASSSLSEPGGRALLRRYELVFGQAMVEVSCEMLYKNPTGPIYDQLDSFCDSVDATLIVMGSQVLATAGASSSNLALSASPLGTSGSFSAASGLPGLAFGGGGGGLWGGGGGGMVAGSGGSFSSPSSAMAVMASGMSFSGPGGGGGNAIVASVALSLLRNTTRPVLIVKANAKYAGVAWDRGEKLRVLMEVHHTSRSLLRYVCGQLMEARRDDRLFLGRGGGRDPQGQEALTSRRLLSNFSDIAAQWNVGAVKRPMEEPFEVGGLKYAEHDRVNLVAMQAPAGRGVPAHILHVLKGARCGVLIYKSNDTS